MMRFQTFLLVGILAAAEPAFGQSDSALLAQIVANTQATTAGTGTIASGITTASTLIIKAIQDLQAQELANTTVIEQAQANLAQVQDRQNVANAISAERLYAIKSASSGYSSCNTIYRGSAMGSFTPALLAYKEGYFNDDHEWLSNQRMINSTPMPSGLSVSVADQSSIKTHCGNFADQSDIDQNICPGVKSVSVDPGADQNLGHLFDMISMNTSDAAASQAYLRLAVHPEPFTPISPSIANTTAGVDEELRRESVAARLSAATSLISIGLANRQPLTNDSQLNDWAEGTAKNVSGYSPDPKTNLYFPNGVSLDAAEKLAADNFVANTNYTTAAAAAQEPQLLKDLVNIEAFRAEVDVENKLIMEQQAAGIGVLIAAQVKTDGSTR